MVLWRGFQKPKRLATDTETLTDKYGRFYAQPFERGFGTTIGNALRRVLLSSIEGAAVTAVKIEGVLHEFQSIPGVVEDATDIILNLKQVPFKLNGDGPKAIYLKAEQPGVITSAMIEADGDVEILDKTVYIATVSEGGKLDMEMRLKRGRSEEHTSELQSRRDLVCRLLLEKKKKKNHTEKKNRKDEIFHKIVQISHKQLQCDYSRSDTVLLHAHTSAQLTGRPLRVDRVAVR